MKNSPAKAKLLGKYIGIIEEVDDTKQENSGGKEQPAGNGKKLHRVKVRVFGIYADEIPTEQLPWAYYILPLGSRPGEGGVMPVQIGDHVFVEFLYGDDRRPLITGAVHYCPEEKPNLPPELWGGEGELEHKRVGDETSPGKREYPYHIAFDQYGYLAELYKEKTLVITHRESGTAISIDKDGNIIIHSEKNLWSSAQEKQRIIIEKDRKMEIKGSVESTIGEDEKRDISGKLETTVGSTESRDVGGNRDTTIGGNETLDVSGSLSITVGGSATVKIGGSATVQVGGTTNVTSGGVCSVKAPLINLN